MVYGPNDIGSRRQLWVDLLRSQPTLPWILTRDFNCIHSSIEMRGSTIRNASAMTDFNSFIDDASLVEMPTTGSEYTWSNMNQSSPIHCHLEHTLISLSCLSLFPRCVAHVTPRLLSDHNPILVTLSIDKGRANSLFKFYNH